MRQLEKYKKKKSIKKAYTPRSVNLSETHYEFLESHDVNLSAIVRDTLDSMIGALNWKSKKETK